MVVRGLASLGTSWDTEGDASMLEENLLKLMLEARGFAFAGLQDFFDGGNVAHANILYHFIQFKQHMTFLFFRQISKITINREKIIGGVN